MAHTRLIIVLSLIVGAIVFASLAISSCRNNGDDGPSAGPNAKTERVVIGGRDFDLELAIDPAAREMGLMHRDAIDEHGGMLFVFPDALVRHQSFWMKNCLVDIDIMYLDSRGKITAMHRMEAQPPKAPDETEAAYEARLRAQLYPSGYPAQFAIELRSGWLDQLNLKVEDQIPLDLQRLKAMAR